MRVIAAAQSYLASFRERRMRFRRRADRWHAAPAHRVAAATSSASIDAARPASIRLLESFVMLDHIKRIREHFADPARNSSSTRPKRLLPPSRAPRS